jgi:hypothetical protein
MKHHYHLTRISNNAKTGPIPVSTTSRSSCPEACPLKSNGCYADHGPLGIHWRAVSTQGRGHDLEKFCTQIEALPKHQLWRYAQAGDLPGDGHHIDTEALERIVRANTGRHGFGYTHYPALEPANARAIASAVRQGFVINLSCDSLEQADVAAKLRIAPVVTILPADQRKPLRTPEGRLVAVCPASVRDDISCASCGVCAIPHRRAIIGFPAHGTAAKKAERVFWMKPTSSPTGQTCPQP